MTPAMRIPSPWPLVTIPLTACMVHFALIGCHGSTPSGEHAGAPGTTTDAGEDGVVPDAREAGAADSGGDAGSDACYRDPYLPNRFEPPCVQPKAVPSCDKGWCVVDPGCFIMGAPWCEWGRAKWSTDPVQVTLTHRFAIQQNELTQGEWTSNGLPNPSGLMPNGTGDCIGVDCPVGNITWMEALAYANLLSSNEGLTSCYQLEKCTGALGEGMVCDVARTVGPSVYKCPGYRLPTAAEWEYAARAGTKTSVYAGEVVPHAGLCECYDDPVLSPIAWYCANAGTATHPVRQKIPNGWGLHDMIGNAQEWVTTNGVHGYGDGPYVDWFERFDFVNILSTPELELVARGGGFNLWPNALLSSTVLGASGGAKGPSGGVRLARTLPAK